VDILKFIEEMDYDGNGKINYSEFLAATIDTKKFLTESKLKSVFSIFNTDGKGDISANDMMVAFYKLGYAVPLKEIEEMIELHHGNKKG
jgi:calcium-dependent protein kinase